MISGGRWNGGWGAADMTDAAPLYNGIFTCSKSEETGNTPLNGSPYDYHNFGEPEPIWYLHGGYWDWSIYGGLFDSEDVSIQWEDAYFTGSCT